MPLKRASNVPEIISILNSIVKEIEQLGKLNLNDEAVQSEMLFLNLLNMTYGWNLINANTLETNAESIDLIDTAGHIVVQVTATCSKAKIERTLKGKASKKYADEGYRIKFVFVGKQSENVKSNSFENPYCIEFNPDHDIYLVADLLRAIAHLEDIERQNEILSMLWKETGRSFCLRMIDVRKSLVDQVDRLGTRYTPELNIDTELGTCLFAFTEPEELLQELKVESSKLIVAANRFLEKTTESHNEEIMEGTAIVGDVRSALAELSACTALRNSLHSLKTIQDAAEFRIFNLAHARAEDVTDADGDLIRDLHHLYDLLRDFSLYCSRRRVFAAGKSGILLIGETGSGKSHGLADFLTKYVNSGGIGLLYLGNEFNKEGEIISQLARLSGFGCGRDELLPEVSRLARSTGKPAIVVIDALNEGEGPLIWKNVLHRLFQDVQGYENVKIIMSTRTNGFEGVIPDAFFESDIVITERCEGFSGNENYAVELFCKHYGLAHPSFPILSTEFANPLYLKLLCEHLRSNGATKLGRLYSIADIATMYIADINVSLADVDRIGHDPHINLVAEVVKAIVTSPEFDGYWIDYGIATRIASKVAKEYCNRPGEVMRELLRENLFGVSDYKGKSRTYFEFQRLGDVLFCVYRLDDFDASDPNLRESLIESGLIKDMVGTVTGSDVLEALAAVLPEKFRVEIFEVVEPETEYGKVEIALAFVHSLVWRKSPVVTEPTRTYFNDVVAAYQRPFEELLEVLVKLSFEKGTPYNAMMLNSMLKSCGHIDRDASWTYFVSISRSGMCLNMADWFWRNSENVDDEQAKLAAILLGWFCCTTFIQLRDVSTKALASLIASHLEISIPVWREMSVVDDDYVLERLIAAMLGAYCADPSYSGWGDLAYEVYDFVFCGEETYPNILIRDYASSLIKKVVRDGAASDNVFPKIIGPYHSSWYDEYPSNEDIDAIRDSAIIQYGEGSKQELNVWRIIHSMTTEYGRGTGAYGDFGRYVFGTQVSLWANQFDSDQVLANLVLREIFDKNYSIDKHVDFDNMVEYSSGYIHRHAERISKKYQWIGMRRIVARLADNFPPYVDHIEYSDEYKWLLSTIHLKTFAPLIEGKETLPLTPEEEHAHAHPEDFEVATCRDTVPDDEVANQLLMMRDIDPTWLRTSLSNSRETRRLLPEAVIPQPGSESESDWLASNEIPGISSCKTVELDGRDYIKLYCRMEDSAWAGERGDDSIRSIREGKNYMVWLSSAAFVPRGEVAAFFEGRGRRLGNGVPEGSTRPAFYMDNFSSDAFKTEKSLLSKEESDDDSMVLPAAYGYRWSAAEDASIDEEEDAFAQFPSPELVEFFRLVNDEDAAWRTSDGRLAAVDTNFLGFFEHALLFDKEMLDVFLEINGYAIVWGEFWEKHVGANFHKVWQSSTLSANGSPRTNIDDAQQGSFNPHQFGL